MIDVYNSTPKVYYNNSRDFQLFGRTTEIVLNYILTNANECNALYPEGAFLDLLLYTLGFNKNVGYSSIDLNALANVFKYVVKHKGTKEAIEIVINLLLRSQNISDIAVVEINNMNDPFRNLSSDHTDDWLYRITVYLPVDSKDFSFIEDMFDYILPAGYIYQVYYTQFTEVSFPDVYGIGISSLNYKGKNSNVLFGSIVGSSQLSYSEADPQPTEETFVEDKYYTRTGSGTEQDPYVYTLANYWEDNVTYYCVAIEYDTDKVLPINQKANTIVITPPTPAQEES